MVSIPDWSRLKHLFTEHSESASLTERYKKLRDIDAIKKAELSGLFLKLDKKYIDENLAKDVFATGQSVLNKYDIPEKDYSTEYIYLPGHFIRSVKDIYLCTNLTICILNNNYLNKIHALMQCRRLRKLDLHNNQISLVPASHYWHDLTELQFLILHGNPIAVLDNVHSISNCPSLLALTMYDTPLSLKKNYRHHVVNSIWTLKVLDRHVISDEEIIEDANFGSLFSPMHPNFLIDVNPSYVAGSRPSLQDEKFCMKVILQQINYINAHCSPVLILQRYVKGYLVRKRLGIKAKSVFLTSLRHDGGALHGPSGTPLPPTDDELNQLMSQEIIDYDTYARGKRPISQGGSEFSLGSARPTTSGDLEGMRAPQPSATRATGEKQPVFVNFSKLEHDTLRNLTEEQEVTSELMSQRLMLSGREDTFLSTWNKKKKRAAEEAEDDTIPRINFRLAGFKAKVHYTDQYIDNLKVRRHVAKMVRGADMLHHTQMEQEPQPHIPYKPPKNAFKKKMKVRSLRNYCIILSENKLEPTDF